MSKNMRREFSNRDKLVAYLREHLDAAKRDTHTSQILEGRTSVEVALEKVDAANYYAKTQFLIGAVTKLSLYIRYKAVGCRVGILPAHSRCSTFN